MNLEILKNIRLDIEDKMFNDSIAKDYYENEYKQRLIKKYGVVKSTRGEDIYIPDYVMNDSTTAGISINNEYYGDISDEIIIAKNSQHALSIIDKFQDDAYSITSQGVPSYLTTVWTNKFYEVVTRKTIFEEISHSFQQGMLGITNIKIPTISYASNYSLYSDLGAQGDTSINLNWVDRQVVYFERLLVYGDMSVAQMSLGKIDYIGELRAGVMRQIKLHQDAIGFFGYSANMNIYGLLNDPSLYPTITAGQKSAGGGSTLWQYGTFFENIADVISLRQAITSRAGGNDDDDVVMHLLVATSAWQYLMITSPLGNITVKDWIQAQYPKMKIHKAPLLQGTGNPIGSATPNLLVLVYEKLAGQECLLNSFVTLYNSHGVHRQISSFQEKISYGLGGAITVNAIGIQIMRGI